MCFSATASFITAGVTGAMGLAALAQTRDPRELPLAAMPLLFAGQQAVEGGLWLTLTEPAATASPTLLTYAFLAIALVVWPLFAPMAALLVEADRARRRIIQACLLIGVAVAAYFIATVLNVPHTAVIKDGHVVYRTGVEAPEAIGGIYLVATAIALIVSSHRAVALLGAVVFVGSLATYLLYREAFVSVWCFFAAVASIVVLTHFIRARRAESRAAAGPR